jgi:hypothetical protein
MLILAGNSSSRTPSFLLAGNFLVADFPLHATDENIWKHGEKKFAKWLSNLSWELPSESLTANFPACLGICCTFLQSSMLFLKIKTQGGSRVTIKVEGLLLIYALSHHASLSGTVGDPGKMPKES